MCESCMCLPVALCQMCACSKLLTSMNQKMGKLLLPHEATRIPNINNQKGYLGVAERDTCHLNWVRGHELHCQRRTCDRRKADCYYVIFLLEQSDT